MIIYNCATNLLFHFAPEERSIPDDDTYPGRNAAVLEAMNGALQECFGNASPWVRRDERGVILKAPTSVTIAVVQGSCEAVITGWASWMAGCSIVISGHDCDNQIRNNVAECALKYPYDGTSGTVAATVYHDCVTLGDDVLSVFGPLSVQGRVIHPRPSANFGNVLTNDYGSHEDFGITRSGYSPRIGPSSGQPLVYAVETWSPSDTESPVYRIRISPANSISGVMDYNVMLRPPVLDDLQSQSLLPIPAGFVQSIFMAIARKKLMGCPFWRDVSNADEIARSHKEAMDLLTKINPCKDSGITLIPRF